MVPEIEIQSLGVENLPIDWDVYYADSLCSKITKGTTPPKSEISEHNTIPFLRVNNLSFNGSINTRTDTIFVSKTAHAKLLARSIAYPGDVVMNIVGPPLGKIALLDDTHSEYNMNQAIVIYRVDSPIVDKNYFFSYLKSTIAQQWLQSRSKKTSGQQNLTIELCKGLPVPVPPIAEQTKIAQILSAWDKAITATERLLANSQQQKQALMQQLLTGQKRFAGFNGDWENDTLINLGDTFTGLKGKTKDDFGAGQPYIPYINIFKNSAIDTSAFELVKISPSENQSKVQLGDIFFTTSSETPEEVGMSSILLEQVDTVYLNSFCFGFRLFNFDRLTPEYARYLLRSEFIRKSISELAQGATRYNLSKKQLMQLELLLPPLPEQQKIAQVLSTADAEITNLQAQLAKLKLEKKALMQQLLTGQRRVKLDAEVAV